MKIKNKNIIWAVSACFFGSFSGQFLSFGIGLIILLKSKSALILKISLLSTTLISLMIGFIFSTISNLEILLILTICLLTINSIFNQMFSVSYNISCKFLVNSEEEIKKLKSLEEIVGAVALILSPLLAATLFTALESTIYIVLSASIDFLTLLMISRLIFGTAYESNWKSEPTNHQSNTQPKVFPLSVQNSLFIVIPTLMSIGFSSINVGLPFIQIDKLSLSTFQYAFTKMLWAVGMLGSGLFLIKNLEKEARLSDLFKVMFIMGSIVVLFSIAVITKSFSAFLCIALFNLFFSAFIVRYRVSLSVNTLNSFSESALNNILTKQKNYDQLFRALSIMVFGYLYDRVAFGGVFLISGGLMILASLLYVNFLHLQDWKFKTH